MDENFKIETDLFSLIKRGPDENKIIEAITNYGFDKRLKDGTPFYFAVTYNKPAVAKFLIDQKADVNALYNKHYTALMSAIDEDNFEMAKLLLENGADVNLLDKHGSSSLKKAIAKDNLEIVKLLVEAGADPFKVKNDWSDYKTAELVEAQEIVAYFDSIK